MRRLCCVLAAALLLCASVAEAEDRTSETKRLSEEAERRWEQGTLEQRHKALEALEQAAHLAPRDTAVLSQLARAYLDAGFSHDAKETYEHITALAPGGADGWDGLGRVWKRDWLATLATASLEKTIHYFDEAVRCDPARAEVWTLLTVLRLERGDAPIAARAAERALAVAPDSVGPLLAAGILGYQTGRLAQAESLYTLAIARMPRSIGLRYRDLAPLMAGADGDALAELAPAAHAEVVRRFWSASDPDPTTRVNEAQLEYWTRVARASLLYSDSWAPRWDMRAELYVRYGPPEHIAYQPPGYPLAQRPNEMDHIGAFAVPGAPPGVPVASIRRRVGDAEPMWYPMHNQVWEYRQLGMNVLLEDRAISQHYELPRNSWAETDPVPDPGAMARSGLLATGAGRATFAPLPPGVKPLAIQAAVSAFEGEKGPRLLAHVAAPGSPGAQLRAECVVIDSVEHEVGRASVALGASRCDAATTRAGDFAFDLPPGRYRVAVSVGDGEGGRGVVRQRHELEPLPGALALSDVVLVCGPLETVPVDGVVRLAPNLERRIDGDEPLLAYFEVYALRPEPGGGTKFE
jgi:GWxTD domain-containing protein